MKLLKIFFLSILFITIKAEPINTGHAEVAQIRFNEEELSYEKLLLIFFEIHDPTTLNRQGNDLSLIHI